MRAMLLCLSLKDFAAGGAAGSSYDDAGFGYFWKFAGTVDEYDFAARGC